VDQRPLGRPAVAAAARVLRPYVREKASRSESCMMRGSPAAPKRWAKVMAAP